MQKTNTTQQLYKIMCSHHREALRDSRNGIAFALDMQQRVVDSYADHVAAVREMSRSIRIGFALVLGALLVYGIGGYLSERPPTSHATVDVVPETHMGKI